MSDYLPRDVILMNSPRVAENISDQLSAIVCMPAMDNMCFAHSMKIEGE